MAEMITFKYLRDVQKAERSSPELSKLDPGFYDAVFEYVRRKRKIQERGGMSFTDKKEIENIVPVVKSIFDTRERKVILGAIRSARATFKMGNLLPQEKKLFDDVLSCVSNAREEMFSALGIDPKAAANSGKADDEGKGASATSVETVVTVIPQSMKIKVLDDIPEFVDDRLKSHGPWKKGDVVDCARDFAEMFIQGGKAEKAGDA